MKIIRIFKVIVALSFLAIAYAYISDSKIFGVPTEIFLLIFAILSFIVLLLDYKIRQRK